MEETLRRGSHKIQWFWGIQRDYPGCVLGTLPLHKMRGLCPSPQIVRMLLLHEDTHIHTHSLAGGCRPLPVLPASSFSVLLLPAMLAAASTSLCPGQRPDACPHKREGEGLGLGVRHVWI